MTLDRTVTPRTTNPLGVKGIGEAGTIASPPAVINAVVDAVSHLGVTDVGKPAVARACVASDPRRARRWRMIPAAFEYARAESVDHAIELLSSNEDAKILAGGHSLLPLMRLRLARPVDAGRHRPGPGPVRHPSRRRRRGDRRADPSPRRREQRGAAGAVPDRRAHGRRDRRSAGPSHGHDRWLGRPRGSRLRHADGPGGARRGDGGARCRRRVAHGGCRRLLQGAVHARSGGERGADRSPRAGDEDRRLELHQVPPPGAGLGARRAWPRCRATAARTSR